MDKEDGLDWGQDRNRDKDLDRDHDHDEQLAMLDTSHTSYRPQIRNWARTYSCRPERLIEPASIAECQAVVRLAGQRPGVQIRVVGRANSPSDLVCTRSWSLRMLKLDRVLAVDRPRRQVTVEAGMTVAALLPHLDRHRLDFSVLGSISDLTVGGMIAAATHGSGSRFPSAASYVVSLDLVVANGDLVTCSRDANQELFLATLSGLGATGVIVRVTLQLEDRYDLACRTAKTSMRDVLRKGLTATGASDEHVKLWYYPYAEQDEGLDTVLWRAHRVPATVDRRCKGSGGGGGGGGGGSGSSSSNRWSHLEHALLHRASSWTPKLQPMINAHLFRRNGPPPGAEAILIEEGSLAHTMDCYYSQHTEEWAVPVDEADGAMRAILDWLDRARARGLYSHAPIEIRWSRGDDIWLSPAYTRSPDEVFVWFGLISYRPFNRSVEHEVLFNEFEGLMMAASPRARSHWSKAHRRLSPEETRARWDKVDDWKQTRQAVDPEGLFVGDYLAYHLDLVRRDSSRPYDPDHYKARL